MNPEIKIICFYGILKTSTGFRAFAEFAHVSFYETEAGPGEDYIGQRIAEFKSNYDVLTVNWCEVPQIKNDGR